VTVVLLALGSAATFGAMTVAIRWVGLRERAIDGVAALELAGALATLVLICLAEGYHRGIYFSVAVVCAAATWISGLVFARFLGRP
jgi:multisubunit Na+/H+ antiporter MnhF subunit